MSDMGIFALLFAGACWFALVTFAAMISIIVAAQHGMFYRGGHKDD